MYTFSDNVLMSDLHSKAVSLFILPTYRLKLSIASNSSLGSA